MQQSLQSFLKDLSDGPSHAHVVKVDKEPMEVKDSENGFEIK